MEFNNETYSLIKRLMAFCVGVLCMAASIFFSSSAMGVEMDSDTGWMLGLGAGFVVSAMEFIFNSESKDMNFTVKAGAIFAYCYGILSNIIGLHNYMAKAGSISGWVLAIGFGLVAEVIAEPFILYSLTQRWDGGDLLSNLFSNKKPVQPGRPNGPNTGGAAGAQQRYVNNQGQHGGQR